MIVRKWKTSQWLWHSKAGESRKKCVIWYLLFIEFWLKWMERTCSIFRIFQLPDFRGVGGKTLCFFLWIYLFFLKIIGCKTRSWLDRTKGNHNIVALSKDSINHSGQRTKRLAGNNFNCDSDFYRFQPPLHFFINDFFQPQITGFFDWLIFESILFWNFRSKINYI